MDAVRRDEGRRFCQPVSQLGTQKKKNLKCLFVNMCSKVYQVATYCSIPKQGKIFRLPPTLVAGGL